MSDIKAMHVQHAMDDFGTGYSSLSYLKHFPLDTIKSDRAFIREIDTDPFDEAISKAIVALARSLGLRVVAEGVERYEHLEALRHIGCEESQGFFFCEGVSADVFDSLLSRGFAPPVCRVSWESDRLHVAVPGRSAAGAAENAGGVRRICVFCGSNTGAREAYILAARAFGRAVAERGLELVYGGGSVGLMGILADAALGAGGRVIGVLPRGLFQREIAHPGLSILHEVNSMHERKALMADLADAFVALPGGYGTFDELFEIITWAQIGLHGKPIALLDVDGYFDPLVTLVERAVEEGFIAQPFASLVRRSADAHGLLDYVQYTAQRVPAPSDELPQR